MTFEIPSNAELAVRSKRAERKDTTISATIAVLLVLLVLGTLAFKGEQAGAGSAIDDGIPLVGP